MKTKVVLINKIFKTDHKNKWKIYQAILLNTKHHKI